METRKQSIQQIGDVLHLKEITVQVTKSPSTGKGGLYNDPQGTFYKVPIKIENVGMKTLSFTSNQFTLIDGIGREYEPVSYFTLNDIDLFMVDLQPGLPVEKIVVFDIPYDSGLSYNLNAKNAGIVCIQNC